MLPSSTKRHYEKWQSYGDSIEKQAINNKATFPDHSSSKHLEEKSITLPIILHTISYNVLKSAKKSYHCERSELC